MQIYKEKQIEGKIFDNGKRLCNFRQCIIFLLNNYNLALQLLCDFNSPTPNM